jgi:phosphoglycolate phosphatase
MQKKFLLFDFDGVLTDTFLSTYAICQLSRPWITEEEYRDLFMGNIYEELESQNKVETRPVIPQSNEEYFEKYFELTKNTGVISEMRSVVETLTETHELFIISSSYNYIIEEMLGREKMLQHFRKILGADVEINKAKKIASVFSEYNASAESAIFITDTVGDVKEARKAGVDSIAVTWGNHGADRLQTVNPFAIVNSPTELLQIIQSL